MEKKAHPHHHPQHRYEDCEDLTRLLELMKKAGLKATEPRKAIIHSLIESHGPFTAEEIHKLITRRICDLATVYRSLGSLEKAGLIHRCDFGDGTARYEIAAKSAHHHHHIVCRRCKRIEVLDDCELADLNRVPRKLGYAEVSHSLEFFGICPKCV
jgi:Fur family transcriptional regulator, ferric uptake regulator